MLLDKPPGALKTASYRPRGAHVRRKRMTNISIVRAEPAIRRQGINIVFFRGPSRAAGISRKIRQLPLFVVARMINEVNKLARSPVTISPRLVSQAERRPAGRVPFGWKGQNMKKKFDRKTVGVSMAICCVPYCPKICRRTEADRDAGHFGTACSFMDR